MRRKTTEEFIEESKKIHGDRYDYSKVNYINNITKIEIICKKHGIFFQTPLGHLKTKGCPICSKEKTSLGKEGFIKLAKKIHGEKYDYSKVKYVNNKTKVEIICKIHGSFWQIPNRHLQGNGCSVCANNYKSNTEEFIKKANIVHNNLYDYKLVNYINAKTKVEIICKKHGIFYQIPNSHLNGRGCPVCNNSKGEMLIANYLEKHKISFIPQKTFDDCRNKRVLPFDFYLPNYNILIEFDGKQHFINDNWGKDNYKKTVFHDNIKTNYSIEKGIKLIRIRYDEINYIGEIIENFVNS